VAVETQGAMLGLRGEAISAQKLAMNAMVARHCARVNIGHPREAIYDPALGGCSSQGGAGRLRIYCHLDLLQRLGHKIGTCELQLQPAA
jgi:hypothetical protein